MKICALCGEEAELQESHLMPSSLYKRARDSSQPNPNPFLVTQEKTRQTSRQAKRDLLCSPCEQRFHECGEDHVLSLCYREEGDFPLAQRLDDLTPNPGTSTATKSFIASQIRGFSAEKFAYFGASILWRASVTPWTIENHNYSPCSLGDIYESAFREYLLGKTRFPENTLLWVICSPNEMPAITFTFPEKKRVGQHHEIRFIIPGIEFWFSIGKKIPGQSRRMSLLDSDCLFQSTNLNEAAKRQALGTLAAQQSKGL